MPSLADLSSGIGGDAMAYRKYVINCGEKGVTPLTPMAAWVAAGKPDGL